MTTQNLKEAVKVLNESGLIEKKIKMVAVKTADMEKAFLEAVNSIPEDKEEAIPDAVVDVFNTLVNEKGIPTEDPVAVKATSKKKDKAEKKEKNNGESSAKEMWKEGSSAKMIVDAIIKSGKSGMSREELMQLDFESSNKKSRVDTVTYYAKKRGLVSFSDGKFFAA